jgi:hypothetical protein
MLFLEMAIVDVAQGDDVAIAGRVIRVARPFSIHADTRKIQLLVRTFAARKRAGVHPPGGTEQGGILEKIATTRLVEHEWLPTCKPSPGKWTSPSRSHFAREKSGRNA